jgi:hypothetical protein
MPDRKNLVTILCVASSLGLLASVLVAPIRTSEFLAVSSRIESLFRNEVPASSESTPRFHVAVETDAVPRISALPSEPEEQDRADALGEPHITFRIPCSFLKISYRKSLPPSTILSLYPLRC